MDMCACTRMSLVCACHADAHVACMLYVYVQWMHIRLQLVLWRLHSHAMDSSSLQVRDIRMHCMDMTMLRTRVAHA